MKTVVGSIIRNRAWVLPDYLKALWSMRVSDQVSYLFLENDSEDETLKLLQRFKRNKSAMRPITVKSITTGVPGWDHHRYNYSNLASIRNQLLEMFLETDADFFMSVDSDVIVQPDTFERLLETHQRTAGVVGAPVCNIADASLDGHTPGNFMVFERGVLQHPAHYPLAGEYEVDLTGAVYLIPRWVVEQGARYGEDPLGEDIPFCAAVKAAGCRIYVNLDAQCEHRMVKEG